MTFTVFDPSPLTVRINGSFCTYLWLCYCFMSLANKLMMMVMMMMFYYQI